MKRREFITLLGGGVGWPLAARAQQAEQVRKIGLLAGGDTVVFTLAFREQLQKLGWTDGYNLRIDRRTSAAELLALDPDILLAESTPLYRS
jgi:putative tryptophan/tyrosine transport system substrate-binding protein